MKAFKLLLWISQLGGNQKALHVQQTFVKRSFELVGIRYIGICKRSDPECYANKKTTTKTFRLGSDQQKDNSFI